MRHRTPLFVCAPLCRIVNRFSVDTNTIDDSLPFIFNVALANVAALTGSFVVLGASSPQTIAIFLPLIVVYWRLQKHYRASSRELRRLDAVTQSPLFTHLHRSIDATGSAVVRAMGMRTRFEAIAVSLLDANQHASFASNASSQWLSLRLQLLGCVVVTCVGASAVLFVQLGIGSSSSKSHGSSSGDDNSGGSGSSGVGGTTAGLVGLALSYASPLIGNINGLMTSAAETEKEMVAVERVHAYSQLQREEGAAEVGAGGSSRNAPATALARLPEGWPTTGSVTFDGLSVRYATHARSSNDGGQSQPGVSNDGGKRDKETSASAKNASINDGGGGGVAMPLSPEGATAAVETLRDVRMRMPRDEFARGVTTRPAGLALWRVRVEIAAGEKVAVVGRTGSGKR
jgi:ATP-binding cassette subfamily C (CFTR/MRP) protein 10